MAPVRSTAVPTRAGIATELLACLGELTFPVHGSVPYLVDLLGSAEEEVVLAALAYLRTWHLVEARADVEALLTRRYVAPAVRAAAARTLEALPRSAEE